MFLADTPSMGLWLGLPIAGIIVVICIAVCCAFALTKPYDWGLGFTISAVIGIATILGTGFAMWPWKHDYHYYVPVSGKVTQTNSRFISTDSGVSQRYVVVINGQPYGVDDTRASLLKEGDFVKLRCKKEFDWGSSDQGWACKWG